MTQIITVIFYMFTCKDKKKPQYEYFVLVDLMHAALEGMSPYLMQQQLRFSPFILQQQQTEEFAYVTVVTLS